MSKGRLVAAGNPTGSPKWSFACADIKVFQDVGVEKDIGMKFGIFNGGGAPGPTNGITLEAKHGNNVTMV